uniref:Ribonuclease A-domain domain-containing protein n=1 Tax=Echeneis naucrates TaxID=173247 RepID=A0A665WBY0_ECHNA
MICILKTLHCCRAVVVSWNVEERYKKFLKQHVDGQISVKKCDYVIQSRGITKTNRTTKLKTNECKETNTFIRDNKKHVKAICEHAGEPDGEMTRSRKPFSIVICKLKNHGARQPRCHYRGQDRKKKIVIKCEGGFPVHLERDIDQIDNWY